MGQLKITRFLSYADVASRLNISVRQARKLAASRRLRAVKIGRLVRVTESELENFIESLPIR